MNKNLYVLIFISFLFAVSCSQEDSFEESRLTDVPLEVRSGPCLFDLSSQVNFLQGLYGDCLRFEPPVPSNNIVSVPCGEIIFIQPFDCERALPVMEFSCEDCTSDPPPPPPTPDPCDLITGFVNVEYEKVKEHEDCCMIKATVTNNSEVPISIYRDGVLLTTLLPGESDWIIWAQGPNDCFTPGNSEPSDVENLIITPVGNPEVECMDISFPECDEI